jgi:hypothetical protein
VLPSWEKVEGRRGRNFTEMSGGEIFRLGSSGGRGGLVMDKKQAAPIVNVGSRNRIFDYT